MYDLGSYKKLGSEKDTVTGFGGSETWRQGIAWIDAATSVTTPQTPATRI